MEIILNLLLFAILVWFILKLFVPTKGVNQITTSDLRDKLKQKDVQFIDVRTKREYKANKIKKFKNIPLNELVSRHQEIKKDKEVVLICQSGMRSNKASKQLKKFGFTNVTNVKGGMSAW